MPGAALLAVSVLVSLSLGGTRAAQPAPSLTGRHVQSVDAPPLLANNWTDEDWGLSIAPPAWWRRSPAESLNPVTEPEDPVFEVARFQLRLGDPSLYAQPVAPTSGLLNDAGAVLSIGVARIGSGLIGATPELIAQGIPDEAFDPVAEDDKKLASETKKRNKQEREGQLSFRTSVVALDTFLRALAVLVGFGPSNKGKSDLQSAAFSGSI